MRTVFHAIALLGVGSATTEAAILSMEARSGGALPPGVTQIDVIWTMQPSDTPVIDLDGFDAIFNVRYPPGSTGHLVVNELTPLPGWTTAAATDVGGPFEAFFLSTLDLSYEGISGNGTLFSTTIASVLLEAQGNVAGTEITFRHLNANDPLPAAYDGPSTWLLQWEYDVTSPRQYDIGTGNPGDDGRFGYAWPYTGYETYQPLVIVPEPGPLTVIAIAALAALRFRRCAVGGAA